MIEFQHVTKVYQSAGATTKAVDDVSFAVEEGEICVLLGPSGCGKTTLLRMVNRLIGLTNGDIIVNGRNINSVNPVELRRTIGYVIQQTGLFPNMTIFDNVCTVPKMLGWSRAKMHDRYEELMVMIGLDPKEYAKRFPWELSGGQQQRIGVARALAADPPVMLMDEPFGALDPIIRDHLQREFLKIQQTVKKTIVFVSHDLDEALTLGDKIAILKSGKLMQFGTPDEILSAPANDFVSSFIGADKSLKRLSLFTAGQLLQSRRITRICSSKPSVAVQMDTDLRTVLAHILADPNGEVSVLDKTGNCAGVIHYNDLARFLEDDSNEMEPAAN
ncbi:ABC transporter ATP-binding protein [Alicyclobacillus shizuokensis]|uniref:ABC transporter ATP-binding protein n=1 Tax=Alicyclobacillus shizuokensis TaxID=392014 RepID=UPI00082C03D8|nr:ABC transporter ATP-binding protein [Alicyclobacillus shizuokensis]